MQPMTVQEIAAAAGGVWKNPRADAPAVSAVSTDSRNLESGCLFVPWVGTLSLIHISEPTRPY